MLPTAAHHDLDLNPGFYDYNSSALISESITNTGLTLGF